MTDLLIVVAVIVVAAKIRIDDASDEKNLIVDTAKRNRDGVGSVRDLILLRTIENVIEGRDRNLPMIVVNDLLIGRSPKRSRIVKNRNWVGKCA